MIVLDSQLATSRVHVCSSRGKRARCMEQAHVIEILGGGESWNTRIKQSAHLIL